MSKKTQESAIAEAMKVEIAFPACVHIELVQANDIRQYEIFLWLVSVAISVASGFWVSFATSPFNKVLLATSLTFTLLVFAFGWVAYLYRSRITATKLKKTIVLQDFNNK